MAKALQEAAEARCRELEAAAAEAPLGCVRCVGIVAGACCAFVDEAAQRMAAMEKSLEQLRKEAPRCSESIGDPPRSVLLCAR